MATSAQAVTLQSVADPTGAFTVSGVFWVTAPANNVVPQPAFRSAVPGIKSADLIALRAGTTVEVPFTAPQAPNRTYPAATTQATVDADIQTLLTAAQALVNQGNPGLSTAINRAFNGATWAPYGGAIGALPVGTTPQIVTDLYLAVAQGLQPSIQQGRAFGYVGAATAATVRVLATGYAPAAPGVGAQRSVGSSSATDTAAGTGARSVTITYLTTTFVVKTETVALNGVTPVNTVNTDIAYIESIAVTTSGSNLSNAGTVSLFGGLAGAGGTLASIAAGDGLTQWASHYVPAGMNCLLINVSIGASLTAGRGFLMHTGDPSQSTAPLMPLGGQIPHIAGGNTDHYFEVPLVVPGPDRIFLMELPNAATVGNTAFGAFEFLQL